ncbi:MAG: orotate phosphoribosyltransferase [Fervidicoccaceae archaeon]
MEAIAEAVARELVRKGVLKLGEFRLSSGRTSRFYIDMRVGLAFPDLRELVVKGLVDLARSPLPDVIVGVATGGLPWAAMVAHELSLPLAYVRSERKEHGTMSVVEGEITAGSSALVIDDVATTGASIERAVLTLREKGAMVERALVVVDREEGAAEKLKARGVDLLSLLKARDLLSLLEGAPLKGEET